jgi:predicted secreted protein
VSWGKKEKRICAALSVLLFAGGSLLAGDVANFKDLGFSNDGAIYMFGEYGIEGRTLQPWAELYIIDVQKNTFVPNGRLVYKYDKKVVAGTDGEGALYAIVGQNPEITSKYGMSYLKQGAPLFLSVKENIPSNNASIEFRDFNKGDAYKVTLKSFSEGNGKDMKSSFYLTVVKTDARGKTTAAIVGNPQIKRSNVNSYSIKKVTYKSDTSSMIFVIEMKTPTSSGSDIRYMVEAFQEPKN